MRLSTLIEYGAYAAMTIAIALYMWAECCGLRHKDRWL